MNQGRAVRLRGSLTCFLVPGSGRSRPAGMGSRAANHRDAAPMLLTAETLLRPQAAGCELEVAASVASKSMDLETVVVQYMHVECVTASY